jgi:hypothetical protein
MNTYAWALVLTVPIAILTGYGRCDANGGRVTPTLVGD